MKIIDLTKGSFVEKIADYQSYPDNWNSKGNKPCPVGFRASWCICCRALSPILDQLAKEYEGKLGTYKVDVDQEPRLENTSKIRITPSLLFYPLNGKPTMKLGTMDKNQLEELVETSLLSE